MITRLRLDAALYEPAENPAGQMGRPRPALAYFGKSGSEPENALEAIACAGMVWREKTQLRALWSKVAVSGLLLITRRSQVRVLPRYLGQKMTASQSFCFHILYGKCLPLCISRCADARRLADPFIH